MSAQPVQEDGDDVMRDLRQQARVVPPLREGEAAALLEESARGNGQSQSRLVAANLESVGIWTLTVRIVDHPYCKPQHSPLDRREKADLLRNTRRARCRDA